MRLERLFVLCSLAVAGLNFIPAGVCAAPTDNFSTQCKAFAGADFSRLLDAPTQITGTTPVEESGDVPAYCQVTGYVAPNVGILLRLPTKGWNGKFLQLGCGGFCGTTTAATGDFSACIDSMRKGYACIVSDNGHEGGGNAWAYNNLQAEIDHAYRAAHVAALAGKAMVERYYGQAPRKSYFWGCSTGGRQALMEAQRFPWDFDGIIAGCPSVGVPAIHMTLLWDERALTDDAGSPLLGKAEIDLLHRAVVAKCDMNDGIKDGLIGDPRACAFDPTELLCTAGKTTDCLTPKQLAAVKRVYSGPITSTGEQIYVPGAMKGSENTWLGWFIGIGRFIAEEFRYSGFYPNAGPTWNTKDFDFDRDYKRLGIAESLYSAVNPDLRRFKAAGGKLLSYVGWNDAGGMALPTVDYYETAEKTMGGRAATQEFFRLFAVPGMDHCTGGDGAFAVDWLSALEAWVEQGQAPDRLVGAHLRPNNPNGGWDAALLRFPVDPAQIEFSRPVYPYPIQVKYLGGGDPKDAANFGPAR